MLWPMYRRPRSAVLSGARGTPAEAALRTGHRADIQGLRAVAVLLVIGDHLISKPRGGFVGVDVFFVISGFLITGLLLREYERSGRISLVTFYKRRIKRIGPAAVLVVLAVLTAATVMVSTTQRLNLRTDAVWALLSAGNWRMIAVGTDYMHAGDAVSPLQHYWSLGVEEQFYFVWPILLIAALGAALRFSTGRRRAAVAITLVVVASLTFGAWQSLAEPRAAYFSTFSRGWELGAGALVALAAPRLGRLRPAMRTGLGWGGLGLIGSSSLLLSTTSTFPVPWALLPVVGAVAVIVSGIGAPAPYLGVLSWRIAGWVGERSYSLYLWHFPVIIFVAVLLPQRGGRYWSIALVLTVLLAMLSYRFVEEPLRRRSWRRLWRTPATASGASPARSGVAFVVLVGAAVLVAVVAFASRTSLVVSPVAVEDLTANVVRTPAVVAREAATKEALAATTWPELDPSPEQLSGDARVPQWLRDGCLGDEYGSLPDPIANAERCVYGTADAPHTAVLLGDSTSISWMPGLIAALGADWRIEVWTEQQCTGVDVDAKRGDGTVAPNCDLLRDAAVARVASTDPDLTIMTSSTAPLGRLVSGAQGDVAVAEWKAGTERTVRALAPDTGRLVFLDAPPDMHSAQDCIAPISGPSNCVSPLSGAYLTVARAQREVVTALDLPNVTYPDTLPWFCVDGRCPSFVAESPTLADGRHLTAAASADLAPLLRSALLETPPASAGSTP